MSKINRILYKPIKTKIFICELKAHSRRLISSVKKYKMLKSKTKISKQLEKKTHSELVETILLAKKHPAWLEISGILSGPRRKRLSLNLNEIDSKAGDSKKVLIPGKVLSMGNLSKKLKIIAFNFSERAKEKLLKSGCEVKTILEEIKSNPSAEGVQVLK